MKNQYLLVSDVSEPVHSAEDALLGAHKLLVLRKMYILMVIDNMLTDHF